MTPAPPKLRRSDSYLSLRVAIPVIVAMTALRIAYASLIDLRTDEAYYWTWSKEYVLSFLDHPPMIAWFIRFGTAIFGDTNLGVRFGGIVAMLVTQLLLADIARRVTRDMTAVAFAVLLPEAALYYGLLMAKVAPDVALIPFAVAMMWSLVRFAESKDQRWWLAAGLFGGLSLLSKFTAAMLLPALLAFLLVPDWRLRQLRSPYPWLAVLIALLVFSPVLIWNYQHDWAAFRFQSVRAVASYSVSLRTFGDFIGLQWGLVGFVLFPVALSGLALTAWRGYRAREPVSILLSTAVLVPFLYFLGKSLTLRIGDTWPMFMWPIGFAAVAINIVMLPREAASPRLIRSTMMWGNTAVVTGIAFVVLVFLYYVAAPWNLIGRTDPIGQEAGYEAVVARVEAELDKTGATWVATSDYRTYAMLRWFLRGRVPVIQVNERGRFQGFRDPGIDRIKGHAGLYVAREPDQRLPLWELTSAKREPLERVERIWRGTVMDTYALEKITGWTPELSPPPDTPFFRWRVLAGSFHPPVGQLQFSREEISNMATITDAAQKHEVVIEDLEYGSVGDTALIARLYRPRGVANFPCMVDVHGGAWVSNDRLQNAVLDQVIAQAGTAVLALDFRMPPAASYPASVADINLGIRWLKANAARLGGDPHRVGGLGGSSGGHQLWLNVLRPRDPRYAAHKLDGAEDVDASLGFVVVCWPISDPLARYRMARDTGNERLVKNHDAFFLSEAAMEDANPQLILERGEAGALPPALLIQGTADANVTPDMADRFVAAYTEAGGAITLRTFEGEPHTFISLYPTKPASIEAMGLITRFIREQTR